MIGREKRVLLRHYLEQGMNKAVIARDLGVSRRTPHPLLHKYRDTTIRPASTPADRACLPHAGWLSPRLGRLPTPMIVYRCA